MATRADLKTWVVEAHKASGGEARVVDVCKHVWKQHHKELEDSGDLFFTWQYDIRWAAMKLRKDKVLVAAAKQNPGTWRLAKRVR